MISDILPTAYVVAVLNGHVQPGDVHQLHVGRFVTHHFTMVDFPAAYDTFSRATDTGALKVLVTPAR